MIPETFRFFSDAKPGQQRKQDWSTAYTSAYPVAYRDELMVKCGIHAKDGILKEVFDRDALPALEDAAKTRPLFCVDLLSAYGDSFLATVHGMAPEEILAAWSTEDLSISALKPRRFPCRTLGIDLSPQALDYGKRAGIFDETLTVDINALSAADHATLTEAFGRADYLHLGAPGYICLETFDWIIDAFAAGPHPGVLAVGFNYLFMKHHKEFKQCIVDKLGFVNCVGGIQRFLLPDEAEYYGVDRAYSTTWIMRREV